MANVIIKSDERKANTAAVLQAYGVRGNATASQREAAEHIAVRSQEAYRELRRMAAAKIIVVEKNEGEKIAYDVSTTKIIFGDDDLMVNIKNRERDEEVTLDICKDTQDGLTVGVNTEAREYVAQVIIPARGYEIVDTGEKDEDGKTITNREPVPFDMKKCTLVLWALI